MPGGGRHLTNIQTGPERVISWQNDPVWEQCTALEAENAAQLAAEHPNEAFRFRTAGAGADAVQGDNACIEDN